MPLKGHSMSEEHKRKIGLAHKGKKKNYLVWNKGVKMPKEVWRKRGFDRTGKPRPESERRKISETMKRNREKSHLWKGGITAMNIQIRGSLEYRLWREAVFKRDNYTCVWCGLRFVKGLTGRVNLQADHIKPFSQYPELRFALDNGRTLCVPCHQKTDTYGGKMRFR